MSTPNLSSSNFRCCLMDLHALCSPSVSRIVLSLKTGWWCWLSGLQCVQPNSKTLNGWYNPSSNGGFMVLGLPQCQQSWTYINVMHGKWPTIFSISSPHVLVVETWVVIELPEVFHGNIHSVHTISGAVTTGRSGRFGRSRTSRSRRSGSGEMSGPQSLLPKDRTWCYLRQKI